MPAAVLVPTSDRATIRYMGFPDQEESALVDQGGRPLGPRAQTTRVRILDATVELLAEKPMRDLRVIDIARKIGSSPATFYQYFKDVEDVVLHLASRVAKFTPDLVATIAGGDWTGRAGFERGRQLATLAIDHWEKYTPILRARNNASDEGDIAFRELRVSALFPIVDAFAEIIEKSQKAAAEFQATQRGEPGVDAEEKARVWSGARVHPKIGGMALASMLERLAMYHSWVDQLGGSREELIDTMATMFQSMLTTKR